MSLAYKTSKIVFLISYIGFVLLSAQPTRAQGCSDAGACSLADHMGTGNSKKTTGKLSWRLESTLGLGEKFVLNYQTLIQAQYAFKNTWAITFRIPFTLVAGNLGATAGFGDGILSVNKMVMLKSQNRLIFIVATRLKSNNADKSLNGKPLPMAYQTSLGTYDVIGGIQFYHNSWNLYGAYLHSFGRNKNQYLNVPGKGNERFNYFESAYLKRGEDLILRFRQIYSLRKSINQISFAVMSVYRLFGDSIIRDEREEYMEGSRGLTLNLIFSYITYTEKGSTVEWLIAFPVIDRKYRADGLTRNFLVSLRFTPKV